MKLQESMNVYLANHQVMFIKLHNLHWNVRGVQFFALHSKFEEMYNSTADVIDDVAERILMIGGTPVASLAGALKIATIKELESKTINGFDSLKVVLADISALIAQSLDIMKVAEKEGDQITAEMFLDYTKEYQKLEWLIKAHIEQ